MNEEERNKAIVAVARGWRVILDIRKAEGQKKAKGLKGRIEVSRSTSTGVSMARSKTLNKPTEH
jgi:hypothetical protein